jgi:hypothetical protein
MTRKRTVAEEVEKAGKTWKEVRTLAQNRARWRFVEALCSGEEQQESTMMMMMMMMVTYDQWYEFFRPKCPNCPYSKSIRECSDGMFWYNYYQHARPPPSCMSL